MPMDADARTAATTDKDLPLREDILLPIQEQLIVELYSK